MSTGTLQFGLCCINTQLRKKNIFCSRTMNRSNFTVEKAQSLALQNIADAETMVHWNHKHGIHVFRLSSDIFPHFTDTEVESYSMDFADKALQQLGRVAREYKQRITMHPGQFNQVGATSSDVFEKTIRDLSHHAEILDRMGMDETSILCVHGGGTYGDKEATIRRWKDQFTELPASVRRRLCIEPCERQYSLEDALDIAYDCKIPVIFDTHHDACYRQLHPDYQPEDIEDQLPTVIETWKDRNVTPLFHISEQKEGARIGAHSDFIKTIPTYLLDVIKEGTSIDLEVEAKAKEQAIFSLQDIFKTLNVYKV
jgi:UV DNA damage endonuclease